VLLDPGEVEEIDQEQAAGLERARVALEGPVVVGGLGEIAEARQQVHRRVELPLERQAAHVAARVQAVLEAAGVGARLLEVGLGLVHADDEGAAHSDRHRER